MSGFLKTVTLGFSVAAGCTAGATLATIGAACFAVNKLRAQPIADNAVVVITGGSRGLGLALASRFARRPVRLVLASRKREELEQAQATLLAQHPHLQPESFYLVDVDLSEQEGCQRLIDETIARFGRIDVLVNNAGIIEVGPVESMTLEAFESAMRINFFAALYTTWYALPYMRRQQPLQGKRRAAVVNIASIGGKFSVPHMLPYSAAKFALVGFSTGLHAELRAKGIRVTTICPGLMRTGGEAHAKFVGDIAAEQKWFNLAAKTPGIATTTRHAANKIYSAVVHGRAEVTVTPQAWLGARFAGVFPETLQWMNALTNQHILPPAPE
ncbi:MAG: SDR family NAD(P)-dependent oxidoreductase [Acidobacteriaceae bacterium]|nr:SDR family NAD(P)-dependent oxidoreductase [Acidobacteriaceae bacterium]